MDRCPQCMQAWDQGHCAHCGYAATNLPLIGHALPPGSLLNNRYRLGLAFAASAQAIGYLAFDGQARQPVLIEELYPKSIVGRQPSGGIMPRRNAAQFDTARRLFLEQSPADGKPLALSDAFSANNSAYRVYPCQDADRAESSLNALLDHPKRFLDASGKPLMSVNALDLPPLPAKRAFKPSKSQPATTPPRGRRGLMLGLGLVLLLLVGLGAILVSSLLRPVTLRLSADLGGAEGLQWVMIPEGGAERLLPTADIVTDPATGESSITLSLKRGSYAFGIREGDRALTATDMQAIAANTELILVTHSPVPTPSPSPTPRPTPSPSPTPTPSPTPNPSPSPLPQGSFVYQLQGQLYLARDGEARTILSASVPLHKLRLSLPGRIEQLGTVYLSRDGLEVALPKHQDGIEIAVSSDDFDLLLRVAGREAPYPIRRVSRIGERISYEADIDQIVYFVDYGLEPLPEQSFVYRAGESLYLAQQKLDLLDGYDKLLERGQLPLIRDGIGAKPLQLTALSFAHDLYSPLFEDASRYSYHVERTGPGGLQSRSLKPEALFGQGMALPEGSYRLMLKLPDQSYPVAAFTLREGDMAREITVALSQADRRAALGVAHGYRHQAQWLLMDADYTPITTTLSGQQAQGLLQSLKLFSLNSLRTNIGDAELLKALGGWRLHAGDKYAIDLPGGLEGQALQLEPGNYSLECRSLHSSRVYRSETVSLSQSQHSVFRFSEDALGLMRQELDERWWQQPIEWLVKAPDGSYAAFASGGWRVAERKRHAQLDEVFAASAELPLRHAEITLHLDRQDAEDLAGNSLLLTPAALTKAEGLKLPLDLSLDAGEIAIYSTSADIDRVGLALLDAQGKSLAEGSYPTDEKLRLRLFSLGRLGLALPEDQLLTVYSRQGGPEPLAQAQPENGYLILPQTDRPYELKIGDISISKQLYANARGEVFLRDRSEARRLIARHFPSPSPSSTPSPTASPTLRPSLTPRVTPTLSPTPPSYLVRP